MTKFNRSKSEPYTLITPSTPLEELEQFLQKNIFALSMNTILLIIGHAYPNSYSNSPNPLVTDWDRKFVLAVATSQDLEVSNFHVIFTNDDMYQNNMTTDDDRLQNFVSRRGF